MPRTSPTELSPNAPSEQAPGLLIIDSPLGLISLRSSGGAITSLDIERDGRVNGDEEAISRTPVLEQAARELGEYFAGTRTSFDVPVELTGTDFQRAVWAELAAIPFGDTRGYGQIGVATGRPTAGRAVGGAVGANPVPLLVPCHRVLASDRRITGYSAGEGVSTKVWLLDHEGIAHR